MHTITNASIPLKLFGAILALALLAAAAVSVALTASTTQAQSQDNAYADPQPCGPGAETAYQPEPHEVTEGHFALFDAYWEWRVQDQDDENVGILHTNLCPPLVTQTTEFDDFGDPTTFTSLTDSGIDINEAIIHVLDKHQAVVDGDPDDPDARRLPSYRYPDLIADDHISAGDRVWWLRLDDPSTDEDETSDLTLGFSTMRFDDQYWGDSIDGGPPFRYKFELERDPGIDPEDHPHFFAYRKPRAGEIEDRMVLVWKSAEADVKDMAMEAGQLEDLEWVFTRPGTYEIWVHLQGWVRQPHEGEDWRPISEYRTETSEVKRYVIQVGNKLDEVEPPQFGVNRRVVENSPAGTLVGDPVHVLQTDVDDLEYRLSGEGHGHFALVPYAEAHSVQIVVADGAELDYETRPVYDLTLGVTDNLDHESNWDPSLDDTLLVRITLDGVPTSAAIQVDNPNPLVGDAVTFTAVVTDFGEGHEVAYYFYDSEGGGVTAPTYTLEHVNPATVTVGLMAVYETEASPDPVSVEAQPVTVTWRSR